MIHVLNIDPKYFAAVRSGKKRFELCRNDRNFQVGDYIVLNEYDRIQKAYTGRTELVQISYIMNPNDVMTCEGDFVLMSLSLELKSEDDSNDTKEDK